ncbi:hypothetical protein ACIREE_37270 [Streptomyces sp. NPDC102467]|uniref:hypothetical protein n=1 Tax=Streptomyces sp. NPDC102467 TaxID=3366179 RepID=UPI003829CD2D
MTTSAPALTLPRPRPTGSLRPVLRLHRTALWVWAGYVLLVGGALLWLGGPGAAAARRDEPRCVGGDMCEVFSGPRTHYEQLTAAAGTLLTVTPFLVAAYAGALLIGRELERGTAALLWTQSVSPPRWLATTLAAPAALIIATLTPLALLNRAAWGASDDFLGTAWYADEAFVPTGLLPVAYALLGLAFGAFAGLFTRSTVKSPALAVAALFAVSTLLGRYRVSLWPTVTTTGTGALRPPADAQVLVHGTVLRTGERVTNNNACVGDQGADLRRCTAQFRDFWVTYHPSSHYWPLQLAESTVVLTITAATVAATFWLLRRRTA